MAFVNKKTPFWAENKRHLVLTILGVYIRIRLLIT